MKTIRLIIYFLSIVLMACGAVIIGVLTYEFFAGEHTQGAFLKIRWMLYLQAFACIVLGISCWKHVNLKLKCPNCNSEWNVFKQTNT